MRVLIGFIICGFVGVGVAAINRALGSPVPPSDEPLMSFAAGAATMLFMMTWGR